MSTNQWHFTTTDGTRQGPIDDATFRAMIAAGQVPADSYVWHDGLPQWTALAQVAGLPAPAAGASSAVSYYNPGGGMPPRAAQTLRGHARPSGDTGDWPLDDGHLAQFEAAYKLRKRISTGAQLYKALLLLTAIFGGLILLGALFAVATAPGASRGVRTAMIGAPIGAAGIVLAFAALYWLTWRATNRSQRWAPLTMFIINLVLWGIEILSMIMAGLSNSSTAAAEMIPAFIGMIFSAAFAWISWRAFAAIPRYLACPASCQELLVKARV